MKEDGGSFSYSGLGASSRKLENGSWDAWSFMPGFSGGSLSDTFTAVTPYSAPAIDYTKGIFIVNEDWFGHANGSVNFLTENGDFVYRAYSKENNNEAFGATTQYGAIYGDNFYFISKQAKDGGDSFYTPGGRLVVADAKTLKKKAGFDNIGGGDGRSFVGVDENTGYIGASNGIYLFDIKTPTVGNLIDGTGGGSSYSGQIGNMIRTSKYVFAVKQSTGVLVIDPATHTVIKTISGSFNTITQSKDGNIWIGAGTKLIKVNPVTFDTEEITLPSTSISGSWRAWNAGSLCNSVKENAIYWISGSKIVKYNIDSETLNENFSVLPGQDSSPKQVLYGAGLRIEPSTNNLIITTTRTGGANYQKNWIHIIDNQGNLLHTYQLDDYYWFPSLPVFPDNYAPEVSQELSSVINISSEMTIDLKDKATDTDNLSVSIVKSVKETDNNGIITSVIDENDNLVVTPLQVGTAILEISFTSNGKTVKKGITINVTSLLGVEDITTNSSLRLYPNPCTDYFFIDANTAQTLSVYSINGAKVLEKPIKEGKNQINVSHLNQGVYFIKANNQTYKVIKK